MMHWYALQCLTRKEDLVAQQVIARGLEVFAPRIRIQPVNPRSRHDKPYFPGYIFVYAAMQEVGLSTFNYLPNAVGLVCFGGEPATVPDEMIEVIDQQVHSINLAGGEIFTTIKQGEAVVITHGPLAGYEAIFDVRVRDTDRVRVLLDMLSNCQVAVELSVGQIRQAH